MNVRNFCIIAHIDHGKSTLADRLIELTGTVAKRDFKHQQILDTMDIEQERGITIKLQPVRMDWKGVQLNLIDTPGHADFQYEVSRSLAACEGALLVIDASQGIEAQTLANVFLAMEHNLKLIPVLNKIDLPASDPEKVLAELEHTLAIPKEEAILISAKEGTNVDAVLDAVIARIPAPKKSDSDETRALIFDSIFDPYRGVVIYVRTVSGHLKRGDTVHLLGAKGSFEILEVGCFKPKYHALERLNEGEIGYIVTGLKSVRDARVGDTVWKTGAAKRPPEAALMLPGYKKVTPFVFAGLFAVEADDYPALREALEKLSLNDSALTFEPERSNALGFGFRCGFLGLLHMDIVQERLEREYNLDLLITSPSVTYEIVKSGEEVRIHNPGELPDSGSYTEIREPWVKVEIVTPKDTLGSVLDLVQKRRGVQKNMSFLDEDRMLVTYEMPLAAIVTDFYDVLKSITSGYASLAYEHLDMRAGSLVRVDMLVAGDRVDALSFIAHTSESEYIGRRLCEKLKDIIPKQLFTIPIQAAVGARIIARETISAYRKDVTGYLYGGDVTRKKKLLEKQKKGKKRMKQFGKVELPQEAFLAVLKRD